jgi:N-acetylmuramoyl-L-alanine amidase
MLKNIIFLFGGPKMNRRIFLRNSLHTCCALWFGQNILQCSNAFANAAELRPLRIINMHWLFRNIQISNQTYFRIVIDTSDKCEIIRTQTPQYIQIIIKNCNVGKFAGTSTFLNPFTSKLEVKQIHQKDIQIRVFLLQALSPPEMRCVLLPPTNFNNAYRLTIDIGTFSAPTAIKESNLAIKETNLAFGPLEIRPETTLLIIHHVGLTDMDVSAAQIHQMHLENGWSGIGYHYVIRKNGSIERGRPRDDVGAHTYGYNKESIGINLVGNFEYAIPQNEQIESAAKLIAALCHIYNILPDYSTILGHKDLNATLCPGKNLYEKLQLIRDKSLDYLNIINY